MTVDQLAVLCRRLTYETDAVRVTPSMRSLAESIVEQVRAGAAPAELAAELEQLEALLLEAGYAAGLGPIRGYQQLPGGGDGHRILEVLTCPGGSCSRLEPPGSDPVGCAVHDRPMARTRLRS